MLHRPEHGTEQRSLSFPLGTTAEVTLTAAYAQQDLCGRCRVPSLQPIPVLGALPPPQCLGAGGREVLLLCFQLPPTPKKEKKLRFDFSEAALKEITRHSKEKASFFPTYRLGCKTNLSLHKREKKTTPYC